VTKTIVVGLDGAGFELLDPWLRSGELPTLERLVEVGVSGDLRSVHPPVTSPNWKAYSTGLNPGNIGVFWWHNIDVENERVYLPADRYHQNTEFWERIAEREPVGVIGMPTTYPPKQVDDFVVSGAPDGWNDGFAHPPSLESELRERFDYRVTRRHQFTTDPEAAVEEIHDLIDLRFRAAEHLVEERDPAFLHVTTFFINALHHHIWDDKRTLAAWKLIDDHLATLRASCDDLVLMSDHGHTEIETVFRINEWLREEGYLTFDSEVSDMLHSVGITADRLKRFVSALDGVAPMNVLDAVERTAPRRLIDLLPNDDGEVGAQKLSTIDWDRTDVVANAQGPVYLTVPKSAPRYDRLREALIDELESLETPWGRPVVDVVHRAENVYDGPYVDEGPDLVLEGAHGVNVSEKLGSGEPFAREDDSWAGVNTMDGLFVADGPSFASGTVDDISILDLAPTLLHLHGHSVPSSLDGEICDEALAVDRRPTPD
jgi:predicted AlkP superfamily phosphohydrolase/phosphomutase